MTEEADPGSRPTPVNQMVLPLAAPEEPEPEIFQFDVDQRPPLWQMVTASQFDYIDFRVERLVADSLSAGEGIVQAKGSVIEIVEPLTSEGIIALMRSRNQRPPMFRELVAYCNSDWCTKGQPSFVGLDLLWARAHGVDEVPAFRHRHSVRSLFLTWTGGIWGVRRCFLAINC